MGLPVRGALGRLASVCYMCKSFALGDWMTFAEIFGMPIRIGKYHSGATPEEKATLRRAVANIGTDASAIMPESMKVELLERAKAGGGEELYNGLCDWLDKQMSKGVLGQTMTAEDGSSNSQAQVHNEVRLDICQADCRQLEATINRYVVEPYVKLNYGDKEIMPRFKLPLAESEDLEALTKGLEVLVPLGLRVPTAQIREKYALREPQKGEEILTAATTRENPPEDTDVALNSQQFHEHDEIIDELEDWQDQMIPVLSPLQALIAETETESEFIEQLPGLLSEMDSRELVEALARAAFKKRGEGNTDG